MIVKSEKYKILIAHYKKNKLQHLCQCSTNEPKYSLILPINGILDIYFATYFWTQYLYWLVEVHVICSF